MCFNDTEAQRNEKLSSEIYKIFFQGVLAGFEEERMYLSFEIELNFFSFGISFKLLVKDPHFLQQT